VFWLGGESGGLHRFDRRTGTFPRFTHDPEHPQSIGGNYVVRMNQEGDGDLWIGTRGDGLNRFHPGSGKDRRTRERAFEPFFSPTAIDAEVMEESAIDG
jgi:hypothetical protein